MNIFQDLTFKWWQGGLFKWGVFLLGIVVGAYWNTIFMPYLPFMLIISALFLSYITCVWFKQINTKP